MSFETVLVANRGEIAVRVIRTLRTMGIRSVAVFSDADAGARHVAEADVAVRIGPAAARQSYLDIDAVVSAARRTGAQAVHPGYGFLSENAEFAAALQDAGIVFIGPPVGAIRTMGDKIAAKAAVSAFGVPVVPGISRPGLTDDDLIGGAPDVGFPVLVKPSAGGGGKGMRMVHDASELPAALISARREAAAAFGDDTLFLERFVLNPRHIEVQVLADGFGNVIHLGERECSLQRRHQKVIEEAPSPLLDAGTRARIGAAACNTARSVDYTGAGTVEFIVSADRPDEFFFMEMNTRLQVEHPVTEMVTGIDLVEQQVRIAAGEKLPIAQDDVVLHGHAVEARVYAEDPGRGFLPTGGTVHGLSEPTGAGVRVDSGLTAGAVVGSDYDPMLAKVIAHGADRPAALRSLDRALARTAVLGVDTNIDFVRFLLTDRDVAAGRLDTGLLDRRAPDYTPAEVSDDDLIAAAAYLWLRQWPTPGGDLWAVPSGWRIGDHAPTTHRLRSGKRTDHVHLTGSPRAATARVEDGETRSLTATLDGERLVVTLDGLRGDYLVAADGAQMWLAGADRTVAVEEVREAPVRQDDAHSGDAELTSPMPGSVVAVGIEAGATVTSGAVVVTVEAMKMEHALTAPVDGVVELLVAVGDQVKVGQPLARILATDKGDQS
ncbi:acetyl-CoA carboxylase biotin carboxylase subunit [Mycolicibacterium litorale]|uniref:biotin carboxylase n=1 Tax=Mycolicibacterium litorale TaxID=758802 RepID=A0AAD1MTF4_9MYCO|nr:acetyl/propionyl/methylcrotonyl-CoA carboxylase subunit alpha [Mycolicibacterium litorale]MCV7413879.1 acetyl/propionyl/methylcrotonyl-CoA carboxylase subunit alpha [Mycolicibacterium litorale]TDY03237.1 acetyl-CoA/propionyl-CoA carboxylase, biotin carboxylase, biotin carboxyl carrier protein [Mycolicibacterium litorale]BBY15031.1 acetyl/propionyl-CoA carboxylase subuit alpha [Mycolicibacterium litorale]